MDPFLPAPQPRRWRKSVYAASLALPFATMQVWAIVLLLTTLNVTGPVALAFLLVVAGAVVAAIEGVHWAWRLGSLQPKTKAGTSY